MNTSALCPPNVSFLGDDVIGSVVQRVARPRSIQLNPVVLDSNHRTPPCQRQPRGWMHYKATSPSKGPDLTSDIRKEEYFSPRNNKRKASEPLASLDAKRRHHGDEEGLGIKLNTVPMKENIELGSIRELLKLDQAKERKRRRDSQRRYRLKKEAYKTQLETDVQHLQFDLKMLQRQRCSVDITKVADKHVWNVAIEYFSLFRHGLKLNTTVETATQIDTQLRFVKATMAPDVAFNGGFGSVELVKVGASCNGSTT